MKIYLIRHGETTGDIEGRFGGDYDDHLTENGKEQAKELATQLTGKGIEVIFSSPRIRAQETAQEVQSVLEIPLEIVEDLRERNNYGVLSGLTKEEAEDKYPEDLEKISKDKTYHSVSGSESYEEVKERVLNVFEKLLNEAYKTIAIVSHGGVISTYVREVLTEGRSVKLGDCAVLEISKEDERLDLKCLIKSELK